MSRTATCTAVEDRDRLHDEAVALFQPRTTRRLTREDGREITHNLTGFFQVLLEWDRRERAAKEDPP